MSDKIKIGIMGSVGSFSEEAAKFYCDSNNLIGVEFDYLINAENVLSELNKGNIDLGVMGVSNSISGVVLTSINAMGKYDFRVVDMFELDIRQNILAKKSVSREDITTIVSQLPALDQCRQYIKSEWPGAEIQEYEDTAKAARDIAEGALPSTAAAIANKSCAKLYDLQILDENIQDNKYNKTTFIIVNK